MHCSGPRGGSEIEALQSRGRKPAHDQSRKRSEDPAVRSPRELLHRPVVFAAETEKGQEKGKENGPGKPWRQAFRPGNNEQGSYVGIDRIFLGCGVPPVGG